MLKSLTATCTDVSEEASEGVTGAVAKDVADAEHQ